MASVIPDINRELCLVHGVQIRTAELKEYVKICINIIYIYAYVHYTLVQKQA